MIQFNNKPPKKLVVKNLRNKPKMPEEYEAAALARISLTIDAVFKDEVLPYGHEEIYRNCETLCKFHVAPTIYKLLYEKCEAEAVSTGNSLLASCTDMMDMDEDSDLLEKFQETWANFQRHYNLLESLFLYLDKIFINQQENDSGSSSSSSSFIHIRRIGLNFFKSYSLLQVQNGESKLGNRLVLRLVKLIDSLRIGRIESGPRLELAEKIVSMLRQLDEYSSGELHFESVLLDATEKHYETESLLLINGNVSSIQAYVIFVNGCLHYESKTISKILADITADKLIERIQKELILKKTGSVLFPQPAGSSLRVLFEADDRQSLELLYDQINRIYAIDLFTREWSSFIRLTGSELVSGSDERKMIETIVQFKEKIDSILKDCFKNDPEILGTLKDSFESVMNGKMGDRLAELLALHIHNKMLIFSTTGTNANITELDAEIEKFLSMSLLLFRYLHKKEVFDHFYKKTLAQRLLFGGSVNLSIEKLFVSKLREECGGGFVSRMEGMIKDMEQSLDLTKCFKLSGSVQSLPAVSSVTSITVVSTLWPSTRITDSMSSNTNTNTNTSATTSTSNTPNAITNTNCSITIPTTITKIEKSFSGYFSEIRKNSTLKWNETMSSCVMRANFRSGRYDLILTIPQTVILLQFNDNPIIPILKLSASFPTNASLFEQTLNSLTAPQFPILVKDSSTKTVRFNDNFECLTTKKIPLYSLQSPFLSIEDAMNTQSSINNNVSSNSTGLFTTPELSNTTMTPSSSSSSSIADCQYRVDSILVRRMKQIGKSARKDLINFCLANLTAFSISAKDVDDRIKNLIEKDFLKAAAATGDENISYVP